MPFRCLPAARLHLTIIFKGFPVSKSFVFVLDARLTATVVAGLVRRVFGAVALSGQLSRQCLIHHSECTKYGFSMRI